MCRAGEPHCCHPVSFIDSAPERSAALARRRRHGPGPSLTDGGAPAALCCLQECTRVSRRGASSPAPQVSRACAPSCPTALAPPSLLPASGWWAPPSPPSRQVRDYKGGQAGRGGMQIHMPAVTPGPPTCDCHTRFCRAAAARGSSTWRSPRPRWWRCLTPCPTTRPRSFGSTRCELKRKRSEACPLCHSFHAPHRRLCLPSLAKLG